MSVYSMSHRIAVSEINQKLLRWFLSEQRGMKDEKALERLAGVMTERECFYVPFDDYLFKAHGLQAVSAFNEFFEFGKCTLNGCMVMPLTTVKGDLLGYLRNNPKALDKYNYPEKKSFNKDRYLQVTQKSLEQGFERQFMCIVEGVYDEMAVSSLGFPCCSLAGSSLGNGKKMILDVFPKKVIISDRDAAGTKLYQECERKFSGKVVVVKVPTKDIDQYLREESNADNFKSVMEKHEKDDFPFKVIEV